MSARKATSRAAGVLLLLLSAAACGGPEPPWPEAPPLSLDLRADVRPATVALLQPIVVRLDLFRRADLEVEFEPKVDAKDFLAETTALPERDLGTGRWRHVTLVLRPVRGPGELVLPPFTARAKDGTVAASTPEHRITVTSVIGDAGAEIEPPGEPFPAPRRAWLWAAAGAVPLLVLAAVAALTRRTRRRATHAAAVAVPPHTKALRALARLRNAPRATPAEVEAFYVEVSAVLRVYLEERFGLRAPERTTEEFLRDLEGGDQLAREHRRELERFLSQCDLVKFAAVVPGEAEHLGTFALAEAFVERTRPDRADAAPPAAPVPLEVAT
jgi:hypothetical protein